MVSKYWTDHECPQMNPTVLEALCKRDLLSKCNMVIQCKFNILSFRDIWTIANVILLTSRVNGTHCKQIQWKPTLHGPYALHITDSVTWFNRLIFDRFLLLSSWYWKLHYGCGDQRILVLSLHEGTFEIRYALKKITSPWIIYLSNFFRWSKSSNTSCGRYSCWSPSFDYYCNHNFCHADEVSYWNHMLYIQSLL